ncbi:PQQ-binding-like beta-propeller repeat protein [Paenibacillaceae bacterium WGS1546]|uniref:outer membrane protein assembly factor BamB family protein n=1 Tax=Cohnella sp. WGS1546 TaxID=3366810 RepID=UPI00372D01CD
MASARRVFAIAILYAAHEIALAAGSIAYEWSGKPAAAIAAFPDLYTTEDGILTFRGSGARTAPSFGTAELRTFKPAVAWEKRTKSSSWGGGAGWTGQPAIVRWRSDVLKTMNVKEKFRDKRDFAEVIYGSLDGRVYFLDLETGEETRPPLNIGNPIKGSVSVDARGYPLLYVGEGVPENGAIGFGVYSLTDYKRLLRVNGIDSFAYRRWGAFDGSALFNRLDDSLLVGGENGIFYYVKLNTAFDAARGTIRIAPKVAKYRYKIKGNAYQGIENSPSVFRDTVYFADNGGSVQALSLKTLKPIWALPATDDTDATIALEAENGKPYLYTGTEVDKQGSKGFAVLRKIDGATGKVVWQAKYECFSQVGAHPVNGGLLATPVVGKAEIANLVVFTLARYGSFGAGLMVALDKKTGKEIWRLPMKNYAWSSPVDVYDRDGKAYLVQADSAGRLTVVSASDGRALGSLALGANIEATPAVFGDFAVVASRGGKIYGIKLDGSAATSTRRHGS